MAATIELSAAFRLFLGDFSPPDPAGLTVEEAVVRLVRGAPQLGAFLTAERDGARRARFFLNDRLLRRQDDLALRIENGDVLTIVAPPHAAMESVPPKLTADETLRYARHLSLPDVGREGQRRLKGSSVLVIGVGGLGSPLALYLAGAGVGQIGMVDFDTVDPSDLHRQILHGTADLGRTKIDSAIERIRDLNPYIRTEGHATRLTPANALEIFRDYDVVVDATDNFPTRYLINDTCVLLGRPNVYGSVFQFEGQVAIFGLPGGPCYRCIYPEPPPPGMIRTCVEGGVLGILPGVIGLLQATEVIKLLLGLPGLLTGRLVVYDALRMHFRSIAVQADPTCPCCGERPRIDSLIDYEGFCARPSSPDEGDASGA